MEWCKDKRTDPLSATSRVLQPFGQRFDVVGDQKSIIGAMDDGIDHRVEREVARQSERALVLRVTQEDVQELVADLDVIVGGAVLFHEPQIDEHPWPMLARDRRPQYHSGSR